MTKRRERILFLSTGDATRSQMAEGFMRKFAGEEEVDIVSTAVRPDVLHPLTYDVMKEEGIDISDGVSKSIAETFRDRFTCVVTICDATRERHPIFPFTPCLMHWSITDPVTADGSRQRGLEQMRHVRDEIKQQVSQFMTRFGETGKAPDFPAKALARAAS